MQRHRAEFHEFQGLLLPHFLLFTFKKDNYSNNVFFSGKHIIKSMEINLETII